MLGGRSFKFLNIHSEDVVKKVFCVVLAQTGLPLGLNAHDSHKPLRLAPGTNQQLT